MGDWQKVNVTRQGIVRRADGETVGRMERRADSWYWSSHIAHIREVGKWAIGI